MMLNIFKKKNKPSKEYVIEGMHCESCATIIESDLEDVGIKASCSYIKQSLKIDKNENFKKVTEVVKSSGYKISST